MNLKAILGSRTVFSLAVAFILMFSIVLASAFGGMPGKVVVGVVPEQAQWIADGTTVYRVDVIADNTGLVGNDVLGSDWNLIGPSYINFVSASVPSQNDFFEGLSTWDSVNYLSHSGRASFDIPGAMDSNGILATYLFTLDSDAPIGEIQFSLTNVYFADSNSNFLDYEIVNSNPIVAPQTELVSSGSCLDYTTVDLGSRKNLKGNVLSAKQIPAVSCITGN